MNVRDRLASALLYLCTDARRESGDLAEFCEEALSGGVDVVQLRDKGSAGEQRYGALSTRDTLEALAVLRRSCLRHGALLAIDDRADIAAVADVDVLHLGQDDLPVDSARKLLGKQILIGLSTHTPAQVEAAAEHADVDYFSVGPCWATPTKPGRPAVGLDLVRVAAKVAGDRPWFPIGGIDQARLPEVLAAGASRIAVVRAVNAAAGHRQAAAELKGALVERL